RPAEGRLRVELRGASLYAGRSTDGDAGEPLIADAGIRGSVVYRHRDTRWDVEVNEFAFEFEDPLAGVMQFELTTPGLVSYTEGRFELSEACLQARVALVSGSPARLCASGRYPEGPVHLEISDLHLVDFRTPINDISLSAGLAAKVDFSSLQPLIGSGGLQMTALTARPSADETLLLGDLSADLEIDTRAARLVLTTPQNQPLLIAGDLRGLVAQELMASNIEGEVRIDVDGIWAIETFLPMSVNYELARMRGALALDASVSGTFEEPVISGGVSVRDAGWDVLAVGAAFSEIGLDARLIDSQRMSFQAGGNLGGGAFKLTGTLEQLQSDDRQLTAALELEPGRVVDLPDYRADIGGQITVAMGPDSLQIEGELSMPSALIRIDALPAAAVGVSPDAVVIEDDAETEVAVRQIRRSNLKLTLGEDVRLEAFGLATGLRGSLRVQERPDEPPEVRGTINLRDGVFAAYGQELSVERGRLRFAGPMDDPSIDVLASRVVPYGENEVTVSLLLGGTAKAITTEVRSTPVLPEGDALALLMTGRTLSEMSSQEQTNVYGAAIALGMYGASGITETVASTLGLEEIIVEQDNLGEVKVGAAVRLNKDLYLRYTYGVFSRLGGVLLRYSLNKRLSVQGQAGDAQSIEIRYGVDG
ncbi:MAG: translocation/assembly module TamB domain-containing protein, partial [Pseudomonadales bacterium]|nr:translocation/assembly module TamB domain-containing protein [Pseudomonadales bacterium]